MNRMRWLVLHAAIFSCPLLGFAEEGGKAGNMTIPAELKTADVRMSPAHGLKDNKARRKDASNILKIGDKYHVWYGRPPADVSWKEICTRPNMEQIWMATSKDGHHWTEHGRVLPPSKPGAWHERAAHAPHMVPWNGKYYLFFSAFHGPYSKKNPCIGEKHFGLAVADQPEGPYEHVQDTPIFSPSPDPKAFDHYLIDDPCIIRRDGKFWMYYKGKNSETGECKLGVATSEKITGPFKRPQAKPVCDAPWHTGCVWPHGDGVAGIVDQTYLAYSSDGLHFRLGAKVPPDLSDNGVYCPDAFDDAHKGRGITWGLCNQYGGVVDVRLRRFDCDLRAIAPAKPVAAAHTVVPPEPLEPPPGDTTYYVDPIDGNDVHKGTSAQSAWKSLAKLDGVELQPGDKILLKAGCRFTGRLHPKGSGAAGKPIVIDRYGEGVDPVVAGQGKVENTIRLHNQHHCEIRNLTVTNTDGGGWDDEGRAIRRAVYVTAEDAGDVEHIHLKNLEIRDVRGMYRFEGHQTNGGIICQVTGTSKKTWLVDLRIEGCTFRTNSIDRYPVVVTSSWKKDPACEVVWKDNTLDHAGRAHIVIPAYQWPRELVYYFDPEVRQVFPLFKTASPISPLTGRVGCEDIFSEMAARLKRSWSFFETTRVREGAWLFADRPGGKVHHVDEGARVSPTYPLAYYGELRALGFTPPWLDPDQPEMRKRENAILEKWVEELETVGLNREADWTIRNRVFMNKTKWAQPRTGKSFLRSLSPGGVLPDLSTREKSLKYFNSLPWRNNPYSACGRIGHALDLYMAKRRMAGEDPEDESYRYVKELVDKQFQHDKGYWGGQGAGFVNRTSGNMKILCTYARFDWEIPAPRKIIDYHLSGATEEAGFEGSGCSAFNQMHPLASISRQYPELRSYRGEEIDKYTAMTFMTFLKNWNERTNFYGQDWLGKHNNGVPLFMPHLMLDLPVMRVSTVYNWREGPILNRGKDGKTRWNKVIYQTKGFPFGG